MEKVFELSNPFSTNVSLLYPQFHFFAPAYYHQNSNWDSNTRM